LGAGAVAEWEDGKAVEQEHQPVKESACEVLRAGPNVEHPLIPKHQHILSCPVFPATGFNEQVFSACETRLPAPHLHKSIPLSVTSHLRP
jgi:hypothetical protein